MVTEILSFRLLIRFLGVIGGLTALVTFLYFSFYAEIWNSSAVDRLFQYVILGCPGSMLLTIFLVQIALRPIALFFTLIHAAFYSFIVTILLVTYAPGDSLGDMFAAAILTVYLIIYAVLLAWTGFICLLKPNFLRFPGKTLIFFAAVITLLTGWVAGIGAWSLVIPARVMQAAEKTAGESPYCIIAVKDVVRSKLDLNGASLYSQRENGRAWSFHALLIVEDVPNRTFLNWSFRKNSFDVLDDDTRKSMDLNRNVCVASPHFARNLPLF